MNCDYTAKCETRRTRLNTRLDDPNLLLLALLAYLPHLGLDGVLLDLVDLQLPEHRIHDTQQTTRCQRVDAGEEMRHVGLREWVLGR